MNPISFLFKALWAMRTTLSWVIVFFTLGSFALPEFVMLMFWVALVALVILAAKTRRYIWAVPIWGDMERRRNKGEFPGALIRNADKEHHKLLYKARKIWEPMMIQSGLTRGDEENLRVPSVAAIKSEPRGPILFVRPVTGSSADEWISKSGVLTTAFAQNVIVKEDQPGFVAVQIETADPLADTRAAQLPEGWVQ